MTLCSSVVQRTRILSKKCSSNRLKGNSTSSLTLAIRTNRWSIDFKRRLKRLMTGKTAKCLTTLKSTQRLKISKSGLRTKSTSTLDLISGSSVYLDLTFTTWTILTSKTERRSRHKKTCQFQSWRCHKNLCSFTQLTTLICALALAKGSTWMQST